MPMFQKRACKYLFFPYQAPIEKIINMPNTATTMCGKYKEIWSIYFNQPQKLLRSISFKGFLAIIILLLLTYMNLMTSLPSNSSIMGISPINSIFTLSSVFDKTVPCSPLNAPFCIVAIVPISNPSVGIFGFV